MFSNFMTKYTYSSPGSGEPAVSQTDPALFSQSSASERSAYTHYNETTFLVISTVQVTPRGLGPRLTLPAGLPGRQVPNKTEPACDFEL